MKRAALDKAIETERRLLKIEPGNIDHYRHIKRMYFETNDKDAAWVSCSENTQHCDWYGMETKTCVYHSLHLCHVH